MGSTPPIFPGDHGPPSFYQMEQLAGKASFLDPAGCYPRLEPPEKISSEIGSDAFISNKELASRKHQHDHADLYETVFASGIRVVGKLWRSGPVTFLKQRKDSSCSNTCCATCARLWSNGLGIGQSSTVP